MASFWRNFDFFFAFLGVLGVRGPCVFSGTTKRAKIPKNRVWGPIGAVSAKFSGDLKVAHGDSATDEPKKIQILSRSARVMSKIPVRARAGGRAYGGAGQKRLRKKRRNLTKNHEDRKKSNVTLKTCGISAEIARQPFFFDFGPVLIHFGPFDLFWAVRPL